MLAGRFSHLGPLVAILAIQTPSLQKLTIVETCVLPTHLYGAENWILDDVLLESFQAEIGRRIVRLSRIHSRFSVLLGLSWPSI